MALIPSPRTTGMAVLSLFCLLAAVPRVEAVIDSRPAAQTTDDYVLRSWREQDGLPHQLIYALCQTRDGYIWLGTQAGLARFDGVRFVVYNNLNTPEMNEGSIRALAESRDGTLCINPLRDSLLRKHGRVFSRLDGLLRSWTIAGFSALFVDSEDNVWLSSECGIARVKDGRAEILATPEHGSDLTFLRRRIVEDLNGAVWVATYRGLRRVQGSSVTTPYPVEQPRALCVDGAGRLWIGTDEKGLFRVTDGRLEPIPIPLPKPGLMPSITAIVRDSRENIWVGTRGGGLYRLRNGRFDNNNIVELIPSDDVDDIITDRDGYVWVATRTSSGLVQIREPEFWTVSREPSTLETRWMAEDRSGSIWFVVSQPPYLRRVFDGRVHFEDVSKLIGTPRAVHAGPSGNLWLVTQSGLYRRESGRWVGLSNSPAGLTMAYEGRSGIVWVADEWGSFHGLKRGGWISYGSAQGLSGRRVESLLETRDGALWIATQDGVYRLKDGALTNIGLKTQRLRYARDVREDTRGNIWLSTRGGLVRYREGRIAVFGLAEGLPDVVIHQTVDDGQGRLWAGCSKGIFRVAINAFDDLQAGRISALNCSLYNARDGIKANQSGFGPVLKDRKGNLWFTSSHGPVAIDPTQIRKTSPPPVFVENVLIDRQEYDPGKAVTAPPGEGLVEIQFTALSFDAPDRLTFKFMLEGFDKEWREERQQRHVRYTRIPPGRYTFRVTARNKEGAWNDAGAAVRLRLRPRFYQTALFLGAIILVGLTAVAGVIHLRTHALRLREKELARRVQEEIEKVQLLRGLLPICAWCKRIRDDSGYWSQIEAYISSHSQAEFSHGICPSCMKKLQRRS